MLRTTLAGLKARFSRLVLSSIAIVLGVAFVTGTMVLGDALQSNLSDTFAKQARNVDVAVDIREATGPNAPAPAKLTDATVKAVEGVNGVGSVALRQRIEVPLIGKNGRADEASMLTSAADPRLRPYDLTQGAFPQGAGQAAVEKLTAEAAGLTVGGQVTLLNRQNQPVKLTVSGIYQGGAKFAGDQELLVTDAAAALFANPDAPAFDNSLVATAKPGVSQETLAANVQAALGAQTYQVRTGAEYEHDQLAAAGGGKSVETLLLGFALIALVVAAMVIFNTFTILIAQRSREIGLLRAVGAERKQVFRSVLVEAAVMGLIASVLGLFVGIGLSALLQALITTTPVLIIVGAPTVIAAFAVGVLVTVASAWLPARRATRVSPMEVLRTQADSQEEVARSGKKRIVAVVLLAALCLLMVFGGIGIGDTSGMLLATVGTMVGLGAMILAGPLLVGPVIGLLGVLPRKLFGMPAGLAAGNAKRNPKRTAATMAALLIGVVVVTMVTVVANSAKEAQSTRLDAEYPADFTVTSALYDQSLPESVVRQIAQRPELGFTGATTAFGLLLNSGHADDPVFVNGVSPGVLGGVLKPDQLDGELSALGPDKIALDDTDRTQLGVKVGDHITATAKDYVTGKTSPPRELTVSAVFGKASGVNAFVDMATAHALAPAKTGVDEVLVKLKDGVSVADGRTAIEQATASVPLAKITGSVERKDQLNAQIDDVLALVWALIGLAVVIALFGIANTLTLSVLERRRETSLLRALGFTRGQLRQMLIIESVLMALMGAVLGVVLGTAFASALTASIGTSSVTLSIPYGQLAVVLVAAGAAAVLAALLPARRAAGGSIVAGMAET